MNRRAQWIVAAIGVLGLAVLSIVLGASLVPTKVEALERGTVAGWWIIWTVIWMTVLTALAVAGFLLAAGIGKVPETADNRPR
jgi:uncharacterized membrane protein